VSRDLLAIIGAGNIGRAMAEGLVSAGTFDPSAIILTRRHVNALEDLTARGFRTQSDNLGAVRDADTVVLAVEPQQLDAVLREIRPMLDRDRHVLISVVSGASVEDIHEQIGGEIDVVRAMPNTAIALRQSMTCLATSSERVSVLERAQKIFTAVGETMVIDEQLMVPATALCACGIAFFLRAVRAASQAGIEIGFHPQEALKMAAQTALGAASLVLDTGEHPERGIDNVTTPRGCTIAGLNELEHCGFSSAMIKGLVTSFHKASGLYQGPSD